MSDKPEMLSMSLAFAGAKFIVLEDRGVLAIGDPSRAAVRFALMASEGSQSVMGHPPAGRKARERYARMTVALFMRGLARGAASA